MNIQQTTPTPKRVTMIPADPQMAERDLRKNTCGSLYTLLSGIH